MFGPPYSVVAIGHVDLPVRGGILDQLAEQVIDFFLGQFGERDEPAEHEQAPVGVRKAWHGGPWGGATHDTLTTRGNGNHPSDRTPVEKSSTTFSAQSSWALPTTLHPSPTTGYIFRSHWR